MIKNKKLLIVLIAIVCLIVLITLLYSCNNNDNNSNNVDIDLDNVISSLDTDFAASDINPNNNYENATKIRFSGNNVSIEGSGASFSGSNVTITGNGTFILSGNSADAFVTVDCGKGNQVQLVLDNVDITNPNGAAILIKSGKKVTITLDEGTENKLSDGNSYTLTDGNTTIDGAIFSKSDLVLNGTGKLTVNGNNAHGIVSKDGLTITNGDYEIVSKNTAICGKDFLKITNANIKIEAGSDALKSDNETDSNAGYVYIKNGSFEITANNDGIQAFGIVSIEGGDFNIKTKSTLSSQSAKAIKGGTGVKLSGGNFVIDSEDDAIHSNGDIHISGGKYSISSGDDGIHADNTLLISEGDININNSYEGIEGTDIIVTGGYIEITSTDDGMNASGGNDSNTGVIGRPGGDMFGEANGSITVSGGYIIMHNEGDGVDSNGTLEVSGGVILVDGPSRGGNGSLDYASTAKITGGVVITLGVSDMAQNFSEATQGSILVGFNGYASAGTTISLCDEDGRVIVSFVSTKSFSSALFSAPEIKKGSTYSIYMNAEVSGLDKNGYAHNTTQSGGTNLGSVTITDYIYGQGSGMMGGGPGGGPGGPGGRPR